MCRMSFKKETPLANAAFWAARRGNLALLKLLLNSGRVDVDCRDSVRWFGRCMPSLWAEEHLRNTFPFTMLIYFVCLLALSFLKHPWYCGELKNMLREVRKKRKQL
uniref:Ankyrin repeat domain 29 n=1 Tax=Cercocebus atys TaxID=9531 RepID=A0A2K5MQ93_CERAT